MRSYGAIKNVLVIESSPINKQDPNSKEEIRVIERIFESYNLEESFRLFTSNNTELKDIIEKVVRHKPYILHFIGHSNNDGILIEDEGGVSRFLSNENIEQIFRYLCDGICCVVINSCNSLTQAKVFSKTIPIAIGVGGEIESSTAIAYSEAFYSILIAAPRESNFMEVIYNAHSNACLVSNGDELYNYIGAEHSRNEENPSNETIDILRKERLDFWKGLNDNNPMVFLYFYPYSDKRVISALRIFPKSRRNVFILDKKYLLLLKDHVTDSSAISDIDTLLEILFFSINQAVK